MMVFWGLSLYENDGAWTIYGQRRSFRIRFHTRDADAWATFNLIRGFLVRFCTKMGVLGPFLSKDGISGSNFVRRCCYSHHLRSKILGSFSFEYGVTGAIFDRIRCFWIYLDATMIVLGTSSFEEVVRGPFSYEDESGWTIFVRRRYF